MKVSFISSRYNQSFNGLSAMVNSAVKVKAKETPVSNSNQNKKSFDYKKASVYAGGLLLAGAAIIYFAKSHKKINLNKKNNPIQEKKPNITDSIEEAIKANEKKIQEQDDAINKEREKTQDLLKKLNKIEEENLKKLEEEQLK